MSNWCFLEAKYGSVAKLLACRFECTLYQIAEEVSDIEVIIVLDVGLRSTRVIQIIYVEVESVAQSNLIEKRRVCRRKNASESIERLR